MTRSKHFPVLTIAVALGLSLGLVACGEDDDTAKTDGGKEAVGAEANEGRAFGSSDEAIVKALKAATKAKDVKFDGSNVRVVFGDGSSEDAAAWIMCGVAGAVLSPDENAFLVYPDGELDCSERPGY